MAMTHIAAEWWKGQATVYRASNNAPKIPVNGCASTPGAVSGVPVCPSVGWTTASAASMVLQMPSPASLSGGDTDLQKKVTAALAPGGDKAREYLSGIMDYVSGANKNWLMDLVQPGSDNTYPITQLIKIGHGIMNTGFALTLGATGLPIALSVLGGSAGMGVAAAAVGSSIASLVSVISSTLILAGMTLTYWLPLLPFVRIAFSVMAWIVSVFEAVVMVPIAALAHISTVGEGLAATGKHAWYLWLNILFRPALTVVGFVGSIMVFNGFIVYFNSAMKNHISSTFSKGDPITTLIELLVVTAIYVGSMFIIANASFKLIDTIPHAFFKWIGSSGGDTTFSDNSGEIGALIRTGSDKMQGLTSGLTGGGGQIATGIGRYADAKYAEEHRPQGVTAPKPP
jgi:conjugal transfer/type IV secretion protein DotA/TraY